MDTSNLKEITSDYILDQMKKVNEKTKELNEDFQKFTEEQNQKKLDLIKEKNI